MTRMGDATVRLFDILLQEDDTGAILDSLARIAGETLGVDRSLIYDVSFARDHAEGLTEWLDPTKPEVAPTKATYPLAAFRTAARLAYDTQAPVESHREQPHPALVTDGSAALLHEAMRIESLLWYPFAFRDDGFYLLAFNHVRAAHRWQPEELEFMCSVTRHVSMALLKIDLIRRRRAAEEALFQAQKLESLGVLAGGVAHDFNNLMVGVVSNAQLLARRLSADSPLQPLVQAIHHAGRRASALAGQMLAYSGQGQPRISRVDLGEIVRATLEFVRSAVPDVPIELAVDGRVSPIDCTVAQVEQVVMNLVVNAAEASKQSTEGVRVRVHDALLEPADIAAFSIPAPVEPGAYVVLEVCDAGIGMDEDTVQRIFDPFFSTKRAGRGLGLSAVLGIVRHHGGALSVESQPGRGSTFRVIWPAATGASPAAHRVESRAAERGAGQLVLCIDDDRIVTDAVRGILEDAGYRCAVALGGQEGLARSGALASEVACVVLDVTMPPPSGVEVLSTLRATRPGLPVVLMSGYTDTPIGSLLDERTRFVRKPFAVDELLHAIASVLSA